LLEEARDYPPETIRLEHDVAAIIHRQEMRGIGFDTNAAVKLYSDLLRRKHDLNEALQAAFPPWEVLTPFTPKRANKTKGYVAGVTVMKREMVEFNPGSRDHIAGRLKAKYGWEPIELTETGKAKIDETVLIGLPYAEARLLSEFLTIGKLVGQLSEGRKSWLKSAKDGAIHSVVNTNGAVTGRMTHSEPNLAQVPRVGSFYGEECRSLFIARPGYVLVGADADALELRCLAGYMALYDGGEYIETVLRGDKALGTDIHSRNCRALGMEPKGFHPVEGKQVSGRDIAKTWFYAWLYGAGDHKLGATLGTTGTAQEVMQAGRKSRARFEKAIPGASTLVKKVQEALQKRGYLVGLDRRKLWGRSNHSALNTLLQSAGAVFMKRALHILDDSLQVEHFLVPGLDYEFVANVHDEWQIETLPDIAEEIGKSAVRAIKKAGEYYDFKCPLDGQFKVGSNWAKTH
jgi:DNA polymerase I-like protein with 3'-5' exonuclease and polymerase domains